MTTKFNKAKIETGDPRLNYEVVPQPPLEELGFLPEGEGGIGLVPNEHEVPIDKFDFYVPLTDNDRANTKHTEALPLSFLQIQEGDVEAGIEFYKRHYPKVPDELIEIMARYNFGDLKYVTRKSIRNDAKKYAKKNKGKKNLCQGLTIKNEKTSVTFE
jgi:hypothetical protein